MNNAQVTIVGNLTADPELKFFDNGSAKLNFSMASDRSWKNNKTDEWETQTSFFNVIAWRKVAEEAADVLAKGLRAVVIGRLEQRSWDDKETGQKRYAIEVIADEIAVSTSAVEGVTRRQRNTEGGASQKSAPRKAPAQERVVPEEAAW